MMTKTTKISSKDKKKVSNTDYIKKMHHIYHTCFIISYVVSIYNLWKIESGSIDDDKVSIFILCVLLFVAVRFKQSLRLPPIKGRFSLIKIAEKIRILIFDPDKIIFNKDPKNLKLTINLVAKSYAAFAVIPYLMKSKSSYIPKVGFESDLNILIFVNLCTAFVLSLLLTYYECYMEKAEAKVTKRHNSQLLKCVRGQRREVTKYRR